MQGPHNKYGFDTRSIKIKKSRKLLICGSLLRIRVATLTADIGITKMSFWPQE